LYRILRQNGYWLWTRKTRASTIRDVKQHILRTLVIDTWDFCFSKGRHSLYDCIFPID
jgi:hypothetical protein